MTQERPVLIRHLPFSGGWTALVRYSLKDGHVVAHANGQRPVEPEVADLLDKGQKLNGVLRALDISFEDLLGKLGLEKSGS